MIFGYGRGSNNNINMLEVSHLFLNLAQGIAHLAHYIIKGKEFSMGYYLVDSTLVQTIHNPHGLEKQYFARK